MIFEKPRNSGVFYYQKFDNCLIFQSEFLTATATFSYIVVSPERIIKRQADN
jgi:hypothetical protein